MPTLPVNRPSITTTTIVGATFAAASTTNTTTFPIDGLMVMSRIMFVDVAESNCGYFS